MARYIGAVCRVCRRQNEKLMLKGERCLSRKCGLEKRNSPPGQQKKSHKRKISDRGLQLREKQKTRFTYGIAERQFHRHFEEALKRPGATGEVLLQILEMRLDNVVYRLGFADSRSQARQLVCHGHIVLNGKKTDIPSCTTHVEDEITLRAGDKERTYYKVITQQIGTKTVPGWLKLDVEKLTGKIISVPNRNDIDLRINEKVVVEYYSR
ncbi:MAG: 30S ribosomal protein S4 [Dehalococcoidia bacterium]